MPDGGVQRYSPVTGATTFPTPAGEDYVTRENPDGSTVVTDPMGMVTESNPVTGKTAVTFADGSSQSTERTKDGSLVTTTSDGAQSMTAPGGGMSYIDEDGTLFEPTVNEDGSMLTNTPDGVQKLAAVGECDGGLAGHRVGLGDHAHRVSDHDAAVRGLPGHIVRAVRGGVRGGTRRRAVPLHASVGHVLLD